MGQAYAHVLTVIETEFVRVQGVESVTEAGNAIHYLQLQQMRLPEGYALSTTHIGVLYCVDVNKDGVFSYDDLRNFLDWCCDSLPLDMDDDIVSSLQGLCLLKLWSACRSSSDSNQHLFSWLKRLVQRAHPQYVWTPKLQPSGAADASSDESEDGDKKPVAVPPSSSRFGPPCISLLYEVMQIEAVHGLTQAAFAGILHAAGGTDPGLGLPEELPVLLSDDGTSFDHPSRDAVDDVGTPLMKSVSPEDPITNWVAEEVLSVFTLAFLESLWTTLERLGLSALVAEESSACR